MDYTTLRHLLAALATDFVTEKATKSTHYLYASDLTIEDPVPLREDFAVKITIEYEIVHEDENYPGRIEDRETPKKK